MTPEQEEQVRRALAVAGRAEAAEESGSVPPDVAARLEHVLADLVQGRSAPARTSAAPPTPHDEVAPRRTRKWPDLLVAAAALTVIAAAGGAVATRGPGSSGESSSAASESSSPDQSGAEAAAPSPAPGDGLLTPAGLVRLRTATLDADVRRVVASLGPPAKNAAGSGGSSARATDCATPTPPGGADVVDVRLDGQRATLVLDPPAAGVRVARIYSCDDASTPVATRTIPQR